MRFKTYKPKPYPLFYNLFLIFPRRFENHYYWLCWVTIKYNYVKILKRHSHFSEVVALGRKAKEFNKSQNL